MKIEELVEGYGQDNKVYQKWIKACRAIAPNAQISGDESKGQMVDWSSKNNEVVGDWDGKKGVVYTPGSTGAEIKQTIQEIHGRTISFADPDYEPGAVEREAAARDNADKHRERSNAIAHKIASKLGGKAKDVPNRFGDQISTYIEDIKFETDVGRQVSTRIAIDPFSGTYAIYFSPSPIADSKENRAILKHVADDHDKKIYDMDFGTSKRGLIERINIGSFNARSEELIKAIIKAVKKFDVPA